MNVLTFDVETTHTHKTGGGTTALPYFGNRLVAIGYKWLLLSLDGTGNTRCVRQVSTGTEPC